MVYVTASVLPAQICTDGFHYLFSSLSDGGPSLSSAPLRNISLSKAQCRGFQVIPKRHEIAGRHLGCILSVSDYYSRQAG